jgi:hypothetical protein
LIVRGDLGIEAAKAAALSKREDEPAAIADTMNKKRSRGDLRVYQSLIPPAPS